MSTCHSANFSKQYPIYLPTVSVCTPSKFLLPFSLNFSPQLQLNCFVKETDEMTAQLSSTVFFLAKVALLLVLKCSFGGILSKAKQSCKIVLQFYADLHSFCHTLVKWFYLLSPCPRKTSQGQLNL